MTGIDLLRHIRANDNQVPFVIMTAFGSIDMAVEAMKLGANDFIQKPFEPSAITVILRELITHKRILSRPESFASTRNRSLLTEDSSMQELLRLANKVARVNSPVLILGESGTGKELLARHIHSTSTRMDKPFVAINCAAIPGDILESELFGHETGSFTGATQQRIGLFEIAAEGTLFLDEVGDMPPQMQVKLLRALQEGEIRRVGGSRTIKAAPRIISATNADITKHLADNKIREDFYYRIAVIPLEIPPLRERPKDISLLAKHYISLFCAKIGRESLKIDETALEILQHYKWPGNARELENVVERAVLTADNVIKAEDLDIKLDLSLLDEATLSLTQIADNAVKKAEVSAIEKALRATQGNKSQAAKILGISYKTLLNKIKDYNLSSTSTDTVSA